MDRPIKILFLSLTAKPEFTHDGWINAFENFVSPVEYKTFLYTQTDFATSKAVTMEQNFARLAMEFKPDLILFQFLRACPFSIVFLQSLKDRLVKEGVRTKFIQWNGDVRAGIDEVFRHYGVAMDLNLLCSLDEVAKYRKEMPSSEIFYLPSAYEENIFCDLDKKEYDYDVIHVGHNYGGGLFETSQLRIELVERLHKTFGGRFANLGMGWGAKSKGVVYGKDLNEELNKSIITIGINQFEQTGYFSRRMVRMMSTGRLYLFKYFPGAEVYFINHYNCVWFNSITEALMHIQYYLDNQEEAFAIGKMGKDLVSSYHTYYNRLWTILAMCEFIQPKKVE